MNHYEQTKKLFQTLGINHLAEKRVLGFQIDMFPSIVSLILNGEMSVEDGKVYTEFCASIHFDKNGNYKETYISDNDGAFVPNSDREKKMVLDELEIIGWCSESIKEFEHEMNSK